MFELEFPSASLSESLLVFGLTFLSPLLSLLVLGSPLVWYLRSLSESSSGFRSQ